jgi:zinc D-Ala-D-Ala carboxypeptidase
VLLAALAAALLPDGGAQAATDPAVPPLSSSGSPPACQIGDVAAKFRSAADWSRTMVDWTYRLPAGYNPPNLVSVARAGLTGPGSVRAELIPDLKAMAAAARAAGARLAVENAYRSYATQVASFNSWVARLGYARATIGSARPGHSEHQLGTALDFKSYGGGDPWAIAGYDWGATKAGHWLMQNAWKYGFVLSYPKGMKPQVCYGYEPWHYRYFGRTIARAIHDSGLTARVWLWRHGNSPIEVLPNPTADPGPSPTPTPTPTASAAPTPTESLAAT